MWIHWPSNTITTLHTLSVRTRLLLTLEGLEAKDIKKQATDKQNWNELGRGMKQFGNDFLKNTGIKALWDGIAAVRESIPQEDDKPINIDGPTVTIIGNELNENANNLPAGEDGSQNHYVDKALIDILFVLAESLMGIYPSQVLEHRRK